MNLIAQDTRPHAAEDTRIIPLTKGQSALVDAADFEWLSQWNWHAQWNRCTQSFYARRDSYSGSCKHAVLMHRQILGLEHGDRRRGDHIRSGHTLDNRRGNLRITTHIENVRNRRTNKSNTCGLKGAWFRKDVGKWNSQICVNRKKIHLGFFPTAEDAHAAYCVAAKRYFGEFACFG